MKHKLSLAAAYSFMHALYRHADDVLAYTAETNEEEEIIHDAALTAARVLCILATSDKATEKIVKIINDEQQNAERQMASSGAGACGG